MQVIAPFTHVDAGTTEAIELSIIMPCLNEARTLGTCIEKARRFLEAADIAGEVVVDDNGSTDGSQAIAESSFGRNGRNLRTPSLAC
jgi:glycosyltransferase involved in cell wall biosynthesis